MKRGNFRLRFWVESYYIIHFSKNNEHNEMLFKFKKLINVISVYCTKSSQKALKTHKR